jgi:hypothetical protein
MTTESNRQLSIDDRQFLANPWILLKVKALGELIPEAGLALEKMIDQGRLPHDISCVLFQEHRVRLSELEVGRYGAWLPHLRREAVERANELADRNVEMVRVRTRRRP